MLTRITRKGFVYWGKDLNIAMGSDWRNSQLLITVTDITIAMMQMEK